MDVEPEAYAVKPDATEKEPGPHKSVVSQPKVSVCIPTFNRAQFLPDAVEGVLAQTYTDFELVICDNASTDDTREVLARYRDPRIRIHVNPRNIGLVCNFRRCLELAGGEYFVILGSDDYWEPTLLAKQVALMEADPNLMQVQTGGVFVTPDKQPIRTCVLPFAPTTPGAEHFRRMMLDPQLEGFLSSTLFRTAAGRAAGGFDSRLPNTQDLALIARLSLEGDLGYIPEPLVYARKHAGNFHQNWDEVEYLKERLRLAREIFGWPRVRQLGLVSLKAEVNGRLASAVVDSLVALRLAGAKRRDLAELLCKAVALHPAGFTGRRQLKAASAIAFSPEFLPRVVSRFGIASRRLRQSGATDVKA